MGLITRVNRGIPVLTAGVSRIEHPFNRTREYSAAATMMQEILGSSNMNRASVGLHPTRNRMSVRLVRPSIRRHTSSVRRFSKV
jgi:hypothetical protein